MAQDKNNCPKCGKSMGKRKYELHVSGICINKECASFKSKRSWRVDLADFLDLKPLSPGELDNLPNNTPVWIEYRPTNRKTCFTADVFVKRRSLQAWFLREEPLTLDSYGIDWRLWPTFKTFRPSEYDLESHPWKK